MAASLRRHVLHVQTVPPADVVFTTPSGGQRRRVRPGTSVTFRLEATEDASARPFHDADAFAAALAHRVSTVAVLAPPPTVAGDAAPAARPVHAAVSILQDVVRGAPYLEVALPIPHDTPLGSVLSVQSVALAADPSLLAAPLSFSVVASVGLRVPLELARACLSRNQTPCVSRWVRAGSESSRCRSVCMRSRISPRPCVTVTEVSGCPFKPRCGALRTTARS